MAELKGGSTVAGSLILTKSNASSGIISDFTVNGLVTINPSDTTGVGLKIGKYSSTEGGQIALLDNTKTWQIDAAAGSLRFMRHAPNDGAYESTALLFDTASVAFFGEHVNLYDSKYLRIGTGSDLEIYHDGSSSQIYNNTGILHIRTNNASPLRLGANSDNRWTIEPTGHFKPYINNTYDIGSISLRVRNIYTTDLDISGTITGLLTGTTFSGTYPMVVSVSGALYSHTGVTFTGSTGTVTATTFAGALSGNATTATTLQTARTIALSGAATGTATSFNGSANITISVTSLNAANLSGTVPNASISGSYTGMSSLTGSGTVDFAKFLGNAADTVSAPSFSWTGDTNTGIYAPAADQVAITTGGVQRALFSSAGVTATTFNGALNGNASTATSAATLTNARTIAGVSFNGSANISIPYANLTSIPSTFAPSSHALNSHSSCTLAQLTALVSDATLVSSTGTNATGSWGISITGSSASCTGNAATASSAATLTTARTIAGTSFNGSANINISYPNLTNKPSFYTSNTYAISGEIKVPSGSVDYIVPFYVPVKSGTTVKLIAVRHSIQSGTSATVKLTKNGTDITGFTSMSVTTTDTSTDPTDVTLADNDEIALVVTAVSGTPKHLTVTLIYEVFL